MTKPEPLSLNITIGEKYSPAMTIETEADAAVYFEQCVEHTMLHLVNDGKAKTFSDARPEAERIERVNLGYYAGYYDNATRERVERLFKCAHPVFGKIAERGAPSPDEALMSGVRAGIAVTERTR